MFPQFVPNHIIDVNFAGFADLVDAIGCVYSDVDHRYYNQSEPAPSADNYASINIQPGYQKLCGGNNGTNGALVVRALPPHRLRPHPRGAPAGLHPLGQEPVPDQPAAVQPRSAAAASSASTRSPTPQLHSVDGLLKVFDLVANMEGKGATIKQIPFPATLLPCGGTDPTTGAVAPCYVGSKSPAAVKSTWARFIAATPVAAAPSAARPARRAATSAKRPLSTAGLTADPADGRTQAAALKHAKLPVYYPRLIASNSAYCSALTGNCNNGDEPATAYAHSYPRAYSIIGPGGDRYHAYRMTLVLNPDNFEDEYYGVQGTTWDNPPILSSPVGHEGRRRPQAVPLQGRRQAHAGGLAPRRRRVLDLEQPHREPPQQPDAGDRRVADAVRRLSARRRRGRSPDGSPGLR